jgi:hypothetical protein
VVEPHSVDAAMPCIKARQLRLCTRSTTAAAMHKKHDSSGHAQDQQWLVLYNNLSGEFVDANADLLKSLTPPQCAVEYYRGDLYM